MFKQNKRGLSAIVATLIVILLAIVAFGIVSGVFQDLVTERSESVEYSSQCLDVSFDTISATSASEDGVYNVTVTRGASGDTVDGVQVQLLNSDGVTWGSGEIDEEISRLGTGRKSINFTEEGQTGTPETIRVYPYFEMESGERHLCEQPGTSQNIN